MHVGGKVSIRVSYRSCMSHPMSLGYRVLDMDMDGNPAARFPPPSAEANLMSLAYPSVFSERPQQDEIGELQVRLHTPK